MTRVLFIVTTAERRGSEVFAVNVAAELGGLGIEADVVALYPTPLDHQLEMDTMGPSRWSASGLIRLVRRARNYDVLVASGGDTLPTTMVVSALSRRPYVYRNIGDPAAWGVARFANLRVGLPLRRAAAIAALFPAAAREISDRYGITPASIRVISNAAPVDAFAPASAERRSAMRERFGLGDERIWVAYVGAFTVEKQPVLAIEAIAADHRLGLVMVGGGLLDADCRAAAASAPPGSVKLLGTVADTSEIYDAVDAVVIPSRTEGVSGVAIEAALSGVPVVATAVGGMSHIVRDGGTGRLLTDPAPKELADALVAVASERSTMGPTAAELSRREFGFDKVAGQWAELLRDVAGHASAVAQPRLGRA